MRPAYVVLLSLTTLLLVGCQQAPPTPPDTHDADVQAIKNTEADWQKAGNDLDKVVSFYADDAALLPPNSPIATGKEAIKAVWKSLVTDKNYALTFGSATGRVDVAKSGEIAYSRGTYSLTMSDPKGKPVTDKGKYLTVFKKQADGSWKAIEDMFNSDTPEPGAK
jgi:ketosteroid isomerase-like protein